MINKINGCQCFNNNIINNIFNNSHNSNNNNPKKHPFFNLLLSIQESKNKHCSTTRVHIISDVEAIFSRFFSEFNQSNKLNDNQKQFTNYITILMSPLMMMSSLFN